MSDVLSLARQILYQEMSAIEVLLENLDERFLRAVYRVLSCKGNVIVSGIGKAGLVGQKLTATFASTGTPSHFVHPSEAVHGDLGRIGKSDIVLILSQSGETDEVTRILPSLRNFGVPIIAITSSVDSTLARYAEIVLPLGKQVEADALRLAPSSSTTAMLAIGDALALVVSERRRFQAEDFAQFHPGGALGRKLSNVDDYLRDIDQCRIAPEDETIREVFVKHSIPGRRSGAILIVNNEGKLTGIFTDSDLARLFEQHNEHKLDSKISNSMTPKPTSIKSGTKMFDAIALMAKKRISELPVINDEGKPIGLIDITDIVETIPESIDIWKQNRDQSNPQQLKLKAA